MQLLLARAVGRVVVPGDRRGRANARAARGAVKERHVSRTTKVVSKGMACAMSMPHLGLVSTYQSIVACRSLQRKASSRRSKESSQYLVRLEHGFTEEERKHR